MNISSIEFNNFKRFTNFTIANIPPTARLVLLVGPNGCGKSSVFDGFIHWKNAQQGMGGDQTYYRKSQSFPYEIHEQVKINFHVPIEDAANKDLIYIRTAYRNTPEFSITSIGSALNYKPHIERTIDGDSIVNLNYQNLANTIFSGLFDSANDSSTVKEFREGFIKEINDSLNNVFGDISLRQINNPIKDGSFYFKKGSVESIHYKNLSAGEKSAFDLILDFHIKKAHLTESVYCIGEVETHMHTSLQKSLLKELLNILPEKSQLWIATHSLGVLRAAQEYELDSSSRVCLLDFSNLNLDEETILHPSSLDGFSWNKCASIALDDLSDRISPRYVVVCEGSSIGNRRKNFDATIYNKIFRAEFPDVVFVSGGNCSQIAEVTTNIRNALKGILPSSKFISLADRDNKTQEEVDNDFSKGILNLSRRHIENYLFDDEVIDSLILENGGTDESKDVISNGIRSAIRKSINNGNPTDDVKSACGDIYNILKSTLGMNRCGNNADEFMKNTLATYIRRSMGIYRVMKEEIIDMAIKHAR